MADQIQIKDVLDSMMGDQESINVLADYLGYTVGKNPVNPDSNLRIYFTDKTEDKSTGVMAVLAMPDLNEDSNRITSTHVEKNFIINPISTTKCSY